MARRTAIDCDRCFLADMDTAKRVDVRVFCGWERDATGESTRVIRDLSLCVSCAGHEIKHLLCVMETIDEKSAGTGKHAKEWVEHLAKVKEETAARRGNGRT